MPVTIIRNDNSMKVDFAKASTYLLNCICNDSRFKKTCQISGVDARQGDQGCGGGDAGRSPQGRGTKTEVPGEWDESKVLAVMDGIRDRFFRDLNEMKTFVPTKDYSHLDVNKRQAVFRCREEHRIRTLQPRGVSALSVPLPPPLPQGPPAVHIDPV